MNVLGHILKTNGCCGLAVEVMTVYALKLNCFAVHLKYLTVDGNGSEADAFDDLLTVRAEFQGIKFRSFRRPFLYVGNNQFIGHFSRNNNSVTFKSEFYVNITFVDELQNTVRTAKGSFDLIIGNVVFRASKHIHASENTAETEFVLTLKIGGDTPFKNENVDGVFTVYGKVGDIKLTGSVRNLRISLEFAVNVNIECAIYTFEVDVISFAPLLLYVKGAAIMPTRIIVRKMRKHNRERIANVEVLNVVVSVHLHTCGYRNRLAKHFVYIEIFYVVKLLNLPYTVKGGKT